MLIRRDQYLNYFPKASARSTNGCEWIHTNLHKAPVHSLEGICAIDISKEAFNIKAHTYFSYTFT
jgi:hypothetical protein